MARQGRGGEVSQMEPITIRFIPTVRDYLYVNLRLSLRSFKRRALVWLAILLCAIGLNAFELSRSLVVRELLDIQVLILVLSAIVLPVIVISGLFGVSLLVIPLLRAWIVSSKPHFRVETKYMFSEDSVIVMDAHSELKQDWTVYNEALATKNYYILILSMNKNAGRFLPRRAFESPEQDAALRDLLDRKLNFKG